MAIAETAVPRFEMGRVIRRTFSVIGKNFGTFLLISIITGLTWVATEVAANQFEADIAAATFPDVNTIIVVAVWFLIYLASAMVLQGGVIHGAVASLNGKRASLGECLSTGLRYIVPLFLIGFLATLGILAGMVLLIVPGIIFAVMWVAVGPACVVEHTGVSGAFRRSAQLTRGYRWKIFGLYVALFILAIVFILVGGMLAGMAIFAFSPGTAVAVATTDTTTADSVVSGIGTMASSIVGSAFGASVYYELRQIKEGIGPEALASVFD